MEEILKPYGSTLSLNKQRYIMLMNDGKIQYCKVNSSPHTHTHTHTHIYIYTHTEYIFSIILEFWVQLKSS